MNLDDLEVDVAGIPIPAWLAFRPDSVFDVRFDADNGEHITVCFEQFAFASGTWTVHCTWPRYASSLTRADPEHECGWTNPVWDENVMMEHAKMHAEEHFKEPVPDDRRERDV